MPSTSDRRVVEHRADLVERLEQRRQELVVEHRLADVGRALEREELARVGRGQLLHVATQISSTGQRCAHSGVTHSYFVCCAPSGA